MKIATTLKGLKQTRQQMPAGPSLAEFQRAIAGTPRSSVRSCRMMACTNTGATVAERVIKPNDRLTRRALQIYN